MTIDAVISMLTFEATRKCKDYQVKTMCAIDSLAQVKEKYKNDFDLFLLGETTKSLRAIKDCKNVMYDINNNGYGLFLKVVELKQFENYIVSRYEKNAFIAKFVSDKKAGSQLYTDNAKDFISSQTAFSKIIENLKNEFTIINADLDEAIKHISKKEDDQQIIALANIYRYLNIEGNPDKFLQNSFNQKMEELNISEERLLANDITYLRQNAFDEADKIQKTGLVSQFAGDYLQFVEHNMALIRSGLVKRAVEKETDVRVERKTEIESFFMMDYAGVSMLKKQNDYSLEKSKKVENKITF